MTIKNCFHCEQEFTVGYYNRKFCSDICRNGHKVKSYQERWVNHKTGKSKDTGFGKNPLTKLTKQEFGY